jgi:WD40 repeat protein
MTMRNLLLHGLIAAGLLGSVAFATTGAIGSDPGTVTFSEVRTVLRKRCMTCHSIDEARGDLDLSSMASIEAGSGSGPVIVPGNASASLLYKVSAHLEEPVMPPNNSKIPGRELDLIKRWIDSMVPGVDSAALSSNGEIPSAQMNATVDSPNATTSEVADVISDQQGIVPVRPLLRATTIASLAVHPTQSIFATPGRGQAVLGNLETGEWLGAINFPFGEVTALKFSADGETLLIGGGVAGLSGTVLGVDASTGKRKFRVADEVDTILALDLSENGRLLAVGGPSKVVRVYSIDSGEVVHTLRKHTDWIMSLVFSPDGLLLASGDRFGGVFVWNPDDGQLFHALSGHQGPVSAIAWDGGSETLLTGCEDGKLRVWNMHHGDMTTAWDAQVGPILSIAHTSNAATLVGGRKNKAIFWYGPEVQKGTTKAEDQVVRVGLSAAGKLGLLGDSLGNISIVSSETGDVLRGMKLPVSDGEAEQLIARLKSMEAEYLAKGEIEREVTKPATAEVTQPASSFMPSPPPESRTMQKLNPVAASLLIEKVEAAHGSLLSGLRAQQQMASRLATLRQTAEKALEDLATAEQAGQQLLENQTRLVEDSKLQLDDLRNLLGVKLTREKLVERLQAEAELVERTEEQLEAIASQPHFTGSEELELLRTLKQTLLRRTEATRQSLESVDQ